MRKLGCGIATVFALAALSLWSLLVPATPKLGVKSDEAFGRDFGAIGKRARRAGHLSLVVSVDSPNEITVSGYALRGKALTVSSIEDFYRVIANLQGPGTAVVGFGPSIRGDVLGPPREIVETQQRLRQILSERGFSDPLAD